MLKQATFLFVASLLGLTGCAQTNVSVAPTIAAIQPILPTALPATAVIATLTPAVTVTSMPTLVPTLAPTIPPKPTAMPEKLIYDFESPTELAQWRNQDDPVMGGVSRSRAVAGAQSTLVFSGVVSLANNGGFAAVRSFGLARAEDVSAFNAIQLRVLGDGKVYGFTLTTGSAPNLLYQARFHTTPGEWITVTLPYADFEPSRFGFRPAGAPALNAADVRVVGFIISDKQVGPFQLGVDWIKAVRI